jgi:hypothetical protein
MCAPVCLAIGYGGDMQKNTFAVNPFTPQTNSSARLCIRCAAAFIGFSQRIIRGPPPFLDDIW